MVERVIRASGGRRAAEEDQRRVAGCSSYGPGPGRGPLVGAGAGPAGQCARPGAACGCPEAHGRTVPAQAGGSSWRDWAVCAGRDPELWFPFDADANGVAAVEARRLCGVCPVQAVCLDDALATEGTRLASSRFGIRAGLNGEERFALYRRAERAKRRARRLSARLTTAAAQQT